MSRYGIGPTSPGLVAAAVSIAGGIGLLVWHGRGDPHDDLDGRPPAVDPELADHLGAALLGLGFLIAAQLAAQGRGGATRRRNGRR